MKVRIIFAVPCKRLNLRTKQMGKRAGDRCGEQAPEAKGKPEAFAEALN